MKTVTIPTCANPFVVIINGKKYLYPAGETVEVSDEIAEVILRHEAAHAKTPGAESEDSGESESGTSGGLTVVELTTEIAVTDATMHYFTLNAEDTAKMDEIANNLVPYILRVSVTQEGYTGSMPFVVLMSVMELMGTFSSSGSVAIGETEMKFQVIAVEGEYNLIIWNAAWGQFE